MGPFQRILVATDFSETSDRALDVAVDLATRLGATVTLLHSYELPVYGFPDGAFLATPEVAARLADAAQAGLTASVERCNAKGGIKVTGVLRQGEPCAEINAVAEETKADLILLGTHGRRGLARALMGSVAEKVVRTASRPVMTVR